MRSLDIAATGMLAQQRNVEVVSNNIANMNTTAFKRRRTEFQDLIYQDLRRVGTTSSDTGSVVPAGVQLGLGVKLAAVYRIHEQGNLTATDNTFDLAIQGKGFFQISLPNGETAYTRDGTFQLDANGNIVTPRRVPVAAVDHRPRERDRRDHQFERRGPGQGRGKGHALQPRPNPDRDVPERARRPSGGQQPLYRDSGLGYANGRGLRLHPAGLPRDLQRQRGGGDLQSDLGRSGPTR